MIEEFIQQNRQFLINYIFGQVPNARFTDDDELEQWIMNDEYLYNMYQEFKENN